MRAAAQDGLPGLEVADDFRHPMWTAPPADGTHITALRRAIAKRLTPLDGRLSVQTAVQFAQDVYDLTTIDEAEDPLRLIGQIAYLKYKHTNGKPAGRGWHPAIGVMFDEFVQAVAIAANI